MAGAAWTRLVLGWMASRWFREWPKNRAPVPCRFFDSPDGRMVESRRTPDCFGGRKSLGGRQFDGGWTPPALAHGQV
jgi:hypothetical protein